MSFKRSTAQSPYMEWAKLCSTARFNLAGSGMVGYTLAELGVSIEELEINGPSLYGYEPLLQAIASRYRVPQECVVTATGTSMANYLAMAAVTEPGDEVLIEQPTYELLVSTAQYLGLQVTRFRRPPEKDFQIEITELERNITSRTRLIVLCNLHNPSGALVSDSVLREVGKLASKSGAYVLVDEVYREMMFTERPETAFHLDPERFMVTGSLTKAYGLSGLRSGWVLASGELTKRMWHINDLHAATPVHPGELMAVRAFEQLDRIAAEQKSLLDANRKLLRDFLRSREDLEVFWPEHGTVVFPRLLLGKVDDFSQFFRTKYEGVFVPGRFFEMNDRMRIGVGLATEQIEPALAALTAALNEWKD